MKRAAEAANLPPVYNGKWARATSEQVQAEMDAGTPFCYRSVASTFERPMPANLQTGKLLHVLY
jgi:hypothetical protein